VQNKRNAKRKTGLQRTGAVDKGRAWIELNRENLRHNVALLRDILPDTCQLMPAVKADAYGHGAVKISRELSALGVRAFCVASVMEGVQLRKHRIEGEILVLGYTHPEQFDLLSRYRLTQTVIDCEYAQALNDYGKRLEVHVKIDTGMKRLGEPSENVEDILKIFECSNLNITGIYTHFSGQSSTFTQKQIDDFHRVLSCIEAAGYPIPKTHTQNSYGIFERPDLTHDYARVGIALYGGYKSPKDNVIIDSPSFAAESLPTGEQYSADERCSASAAHPREEPCHLAETRLRSQPHQASAPRPVLSVKARVASVKTIPAHTAVGYGDAFTSTRDMKVAILSIGYADGIPRSLSCGVGSVLINGSIAPIVGLICMDQIIVDVTDIAQVKQGDVATFIGKDGDQEITVFDLAEKAKTIPNEIFSRLGSRLEKC
jgi:serine/alanine racemase